MLYLSRNQVKDLLTFDMAIDACEEALILQAKGEILEHPRFKLLRDPLPENSIMVGLPPGSPAFMIAYVPTYGITTLRTLTPSPMLILWDDRSDLMIADAQGLRDTRTGAVAALGSKRLARPQSQRFAVIGSGNQATAGLAAHAQVFDIKECKVFSPTEAHRQSFVNNFRSQGMKIVGVDSAREAVDGADVVIGASGVNRPGSPVIHGEWLSPGMHLCSIAGRAELDDEVLSRADRVVIDAKSTFREESYDVTSQVQHGIVEWDDIDSLEEVVAGLKPGRLSPSEITVLKTVGTAAQDTIPTWRLYQLAKERGVGTELGELFPRLSPAWAG